MTNEEILIKEYGNDIEGEFAREDIVAMNRIMDAARQDDNTYYDQTGKQILVGDLLKVFHFRSRNRNYYMFHVTVMEETKDFPVMACKEHYADKPHYRMYVVANNSQRVYLDAKIIGVKDWETKRKKIKVVDAAS